jgi:2',3'-cyclic-nucleotide 2'-phosphodiesterase (5'-nucleotidase family)
MRRSRIICIISLLTLAATFGPPVVVGAQRKPRRESEKEPPAEPHGDPRGGPTAKPREAPVQKPPEQFGEQRSTQPGVEPATADPQRPIQLHVLFHTDLKGRYHWPSCRREPTGHGSYAQLIGGIKKLEARIRRKGNPRPVVLSAGNMVGPDVLGQFAYGHRKTWAKRLIELVAEAGYDAVLVGRHDWAAPLHRLRNYLELGSDKGLKFLAANVSCKKKKSKANGGEKKREQKDFRCQHLGHVGQPYVVVHRGPVKVAILGAVREDLPAHLAPANREGLETKDPVAVLKPMIRRLRDRVGVDVVIVMAGVASSDSASRSLVHLMRRLGPDAPDLLIGNGLYSPGTGGEEGFVSHIVRSNGSAIAATSRFGQHLGHVTIPLKPKKDGGWAMGRLSAKQHEVSRFPASPSGKALLDRMMKAMCDLMDVPLGKGRIRRPMSRPAFIRYMAKLVARQTESELAVLPNTLFADANFPLKGRITKELIYRSIRFADPVGVFRVKGSWLKANLKKYLGEENPALWVEGLRKKGKLFYVNGRLLMDEQHYRVATTQFVAKGGAKLMTSRKTFETIEGKLSVRDLAVRFFKRNRQRRHDGRNDINVRKDFKPLNEEFVLSAVLDANFSLNDVSILHPGLYTDQPQLTRERIVGLLFNASLTLEASNHLHSFTATTTVKYGKSKTWVTDDLTGITNKSTAETDDIVSLYLLYKFLQFHQKYSPDKWHHPIPFVESYVETEITRDLVSDEGRVYRYTETAGMVGPGFMPYPKLFLKVGFVSRSHNILIPEEREVELGLYAGFTLSRHSVLKVWKHPVYLESRLDVFFTRLASDRVKELIWTNKLSFALIGRLFLNVAHEFYAYDTRAYDVNVASNLTVGVQVLMDYRHQTF